MNNFSHQIHGYHMKNTAPEGVDVRMNLSPHFRLCEFTRSRTAEKYQLFNVPREEAEVANLRALATCVLEPVRKLFGKYIIITSGFRCSTLNRLVGGSVNSQHLLGEAADIIVRGVACYDAAMAIAASDISFDQLIFEARERDGHWSEWLHISHRRLGGNRREALSIFKTGNERQVLQGVHPLPDKQEEDGHAA